MVGAPFGVVIQHLPRIQLAPLPSHTARRESLASETQLTRYGYDYVLGLLTIYRRSGLPARIVIVAPSQPRPH